MKGQYWVHISDNEAYDEYYSYWHTNGRYHSATVEKSSGAVKGHIYTIQME